MKHLKSYEVLSRAPNLICSESQPNLHTARLHNIKKTALGGRKLAKHTTDGSTKERQSTKSGTAKNQLYDSMINLRSKETTAAGSCLFKTMETVGKSTDSTTEAFKKGMSHLILLSQDKQGLSSLQQYKN